MYCITGIGFTEKISEMLGKTTLAVDFMSFHVLHIFNIFHYSSLFQYFFQSTMVPTLVENF